MEWSDMLADFDGMGGFVLKIECGSRDYSQSLVFKCLFW